MKRDKGKIILVVVLGLSFVLIVFSAIKVDPIGHKDIPKSAIEVLRPDELDDAKDKGIVLTKKVKADKGEDLVGKSFSFNGDVFDRTRMKYPGDGEFFLRLNKDHTFVLVLNSAFKDFIVPDHEKPSLWIRFKTGDYVVKDQKIKLITKKYVMFSHVLDDNEFDNLKRINDFKLNFKSFYISNNGFNDLPTEVQNKISKEDISPDNDEFEEKLRDNGNYVIKKEQNYWRFAQMKINRNKFGEPKDTYYLEYYDYLHEYDHVYPIPKSINDFIADKIQKGEVSE